MKGIFFDSLYEQIIKESMESKYTTWSSKQEELIYLKAHKNRFRSILNDLEKISGKNVLEIGASAFSIILKKITHFNIKCIDISNSWKNRLKKYDIELKKCDLMKDRIPYEDGSFDIVLFNEVIEHLPIHPKKIFDEIRRVLRKGGIIYLGTPNFLSIRKRLKLLLGINPQEMYLEDNTRFIMHMREYAAYEIKYLLRLSRFKILKIKYSLYFDFPNRTNSNFVKFVKLILFPFFLFPTLRSAMTVIASKK